jgi:HEAT repeat protein
VRPNPDWALVASTGDGEQGLSLLGAHFDPSHTDEGRAASLFAAIAVVVFDLGWVIALLLAWSQGVRSRLGGTPSFEPRSRLGRILLRWREELWFSSARVLLPAAFIVWVASTAFMLPQCYGVLAMPRLGEEFVEVEFVGDDPSAARPSIGLFEDMSGGSLEAIRRELEHLVEDFESETGRDELARISRRWTKGLNELKVRASANPSERRRVAELLDELHFKYGNSFDVFDVTLRAVIADVATMTSVAGFIHHYPRSDQEYLRLIVPDTPERNSPWRIDAIPMSSISSIWVRGDQRTALVIRLLRDLEGANSDDREIILTQIDQLDHPRRLEIAIAGTYDSSAHIRGFSITDVGVFGSRLGNLGDDRLRKAVAGRRLLDIIRDPSEPQRLRGVAATSIHRIGYDEICPDLVETLKWLGTPAGTDPGWVVRGTAITAAGELGCRDAEAYLLDVIEHFDSKAIPLRVVSTLPGQLLKLGGGEHSVDALLEFVRDPHDSTVVFGASVMALAEMAAGDQISTVVATSCDTLQGLEWDPSNREMSEQLAQSLLGALSRIEDVSSRNAVEHTLLDSHVPENVRISCARLLGRITVPESEAVLVNVAKDRNEPESVRAAVVDALGNFDSDDAALELVNLAKICGSRKIQAATVRALEERCGSGSGPACAHRIRLLEMIGSRATELESATTAAPRTNDRPTEAEGLSREITLPSGEMAFEPLELRGRCTVVVEASSRDTGVDPVLAILDASREAVAMNDDAGATTLNARIDRALDPGSYVVAVLNGGEAEGAVLLQVRVIPRSEL